MTPGRLHTLLYENYLCWDFEVYTNRNQFRPVLKPLFIENRDGAPQIKLEYYQDISCKRSITSEYLDAGCSDEELLSLINARMRSDKWFEMPECFTGERLSGLGLPVGFIHITNWMGKEVQPFNVESAGYGVTYRDNAGRRVSTKTVFDICLPTERLDAGSWYELYFERDSENEAQWRGFPHKYTTDQSLVLTGALGNWSFGISAYNARFDPQLCDSYEVRYAPDGNGFLIRIKRKDVHQIWLKVAWLKSEGLDGTLCQQALRHWLE